MKMMPWSYGLLDTMKDPKSIMIKTERLVAIKDKYPKAKHHFLILPFENIDDCFSLTKNEIGLINDMSLLGLNVIESIGQKAENFLIGFHASPSMHRYFEKIL